MWSNQENRVRKQVKNPCEARKIRASQNLHKIISTHPLTLLIISVILQLEQRKGNRKEQRGKEVRCQRFRKVSEHPRFQKITSKIDHREFRKRRDDLC